MNEILLKEYAELKGVIKNLEDQQKALQVKILEEFEKNRVEKADTTYGKFFIAKKNNYTYSDNVLFLKDKVKLAQIEEEEKGIAKLKVTPYLLFKPKK